MPKLPSPANVPSISPARDPGVRAPAKAFESPLGIAAKELEPALKTFERVAIKQQNRADTIDRSSKINQYNRDLDELLRQYDSERDLSDPRVLAEFGAATNERRQELLGDHTGSADSQASLETRLQDVASSVEGRAALISAKLGFDKVKTTFNDAIVPIADRVAEGPTRESINEGFLAVQTTLDDLRGALDPSEEEAFGALGREQIALTVIDTKISSGQLEEAGILLEDGSLSLSLSADTKRKLRRRLTTARTTRNALEQKIDLIEERLGPLTDIDFKRVVGLNPTKAEQFTDFFGNEPSEEEFKAFLTPGSEDKQARIVFDPATGERFSVLQTKKGEFLDLNTKERIELPPSALVINTTQLSGSAADILPKPEDTKLRDAEVATRNFVATAGDAIALLHQSPNLNTFAARAASVVNNLQQEAMAVADALGVSWDETLIDPETFSDDFDRLGIDNVRIRSLITSLAFQAAAASGQTGRAISDKDVERFVQEIGSSSADPRAFAMALVDVSNRSIRSLEINFQVRKQQPGPTILPPENPFLVEEEIGEPAPEDIPDDIPEGIDPEEWQKIWRNMTDEGRAKFKLQEDIGG